MEAPKCLAIIAILTEMARCLNENIAKVQLAPLNARLDADGLDNSAQALGGTGNQ